MCFQLEKLIKEHKRQAQGHRQEAARSGDRQGPRSGQGRRRRRASRAAIERTGAGLARDEQDAVQVGQPARRRRRRPADAPAAPADGNKPGEDEAIDAEFEVKE